EHVPDAAFQAWVLERNGLTIERVEIMHLDRECRFPDLAHLFHRQDISARVDRLRPRIEALARSGLAVLGGALPEIAVGDHCHTPYDCPFLERCWPPLPRHHVSALYQATG